MVSFLSANQKLTPVVLLLLGTGKGAGDELVRCLIVVVSGFCGLVLG